MFSRAAGILSDISFLCFSKYIFYIVAMSCFKTKDFIADTFFRSLNLTSLFGERFLASHACKAADIFVAVHKAHCIVNYFLGSEFHDRSEEPNHARDRVCNLCLKH